MNFREINRRSVLGIPVAAVCSGISASAVAQSSILDWGHVREEQRGDESLVAETIAFEANDLQNSIVSRASFETRLIDFSGLVLATAETMVGWSRSDTPDKIVNILDVYGLPFKDNEDKYVPFCAAGISYATSSAYLKALGRTPTISELKNILPDIDHYHFFPSPSVWDIYYVAKGKRRWVDPKPAVLIPKAGWLVVYDWEVNGGADHVGIIKNADGKLLETIEFNTSSSSNSNGGCVAARKRAYNKQIKGFVRTDLHTPM